MKIKKSTGDLVFDMLNYGILFLAGMICLIPFVHLVALSFSHQAAATKGIVGLWPIQFTTAAYNYAFQKPSFFRAFGITVARVTLGLLINLTLMTLTAYPLSKHNRELPGRTAISWFFLLTMFLSAGLIPTYLIVNATGITNTLLALILPGAVSVYNVTILLNFFRQIPRELAESAVMDGGSQFVCLRKIYIPLSLPCYATLIIFLTVGHWNAWFDGMIYMNDKNNYPLMTYLQNIIATPDLSLIDTTQLELVSQISSRTFQAAQIMIATLPILILYPFMQKYFVKGMTLGALKG